MWPFLRPASLDWARDGASWPNRQASRFVYSCGIRWHVQVLGKGPVLLLIHGTGASCHSWRDLVPALAREHTVVVPDLPGHGFTELPSPRLMTLPGMARGLADLMRILELTPMLVVGHSAGAAVLARACINGIMGPASFVSLNGALLPFDGLRRRLFSPAAKLLFANPIAPRVFALKAVDRRLVERLVRDTGSVLSEDGIDLYHRLLQSPSHVAAALGMMAHWNLEPLRRDLHRLRVPSLFVAGTADNTVSPGDADRVCRLVHDGEVLLIPGLGHLAHEERPDLFVELLGQRAAAVKPGEIGVPGCASVFDNSNVRKN